MNGSDGSGWHCDIYIYLKKISGGHLDQIAYLVKCEVLKPFCALLEVKDEKVLKVVMDGLANILTTATKAGQVQLKSIK